MALPRSAMGEGFHRVEEEVAPSPLDPNGRYEDESLPAACMFVFGIDELKDSLEGHAGDARVHRERAVPTIREIPGDRARPCRKRRDRTSFHREARP